MVTRLHVCPSLHTEVRASLDRIGRWDVEVRPLQGGGEAGRCSVAPVDLDSAECHVVIGGCTHGPAWPAGVGQGPAWQTCFEAIAERDEIDALLSAGAHLLLPSMVPPGGAPWRRWGFETAAQARAYAQDAMTRMVLFHAGDDDAVVARGAALASALGVPFEERHLSRSRLELWLRLTLAEHETRGLVARWRSQAAEYQLALDLVQQLHGGAGLEAAIEAVRQSLCALFGAEVAVDVHPPRAASLTPVPEPDALGFEVPLVAEGEQHGVLQIGAFATPARRSDYLSLALALAPSIAQALADSVRRDAEGRARMLSRTVFDAATDGLVVTDPSGQILAVNPAFEGVTGYGSADVVGRNPNVLQSGRHGAEFYRRMWAALADTGRWSGVIYNRRRNGEVYPQQLSIVGVRQGDRTLYYVGTLRDCTQEYAQRAALHHQATHDALTGVANRGWLVRHLEQRIAEARAGGHAIGLVFIDFDHFKWINDVHGHDAGDDVLREVAGRLEGVAGDGVAIARLGGDEFVAVTGPVGHPEAVVEMARKMHAALAAPIDIEVGSVQLSASMGVAMFPRDATSSRQLLAAADNAMYRAKQLGRDRVQVHDASYATHAEEQAQVRALLRRRLHAGGLTVAYHPIVRLSDGAVVGAEALARMRDDDGVPVSPEFFVSVAERYGMIIELGQQVLEQAFAAAAQWPATADGQPPYLSLNVAAAQLHGMITPEQMAAACARAGLPMERVVLEVVERTVLDAETIRRRTLRSLSEAGARVALDDFGTGYSALSYLTQLDAAIAKLDRSFIEKIPGDPRAEAMVEGVTSMLRRIGMVVVAEGIETEAQRDWLRGIGCDAGQGFLWARPAPRAEFQAWLTARISGGPSDAVGL